ncbi:unnamed protein product [Mucor hiemalis]
MHVEAHYQLQKYNERSQSIKNSDLWFLYLSCVFIVVNENKANQIGLDDQMKLVQLPSYLPVHIAQYLLSSPKLKDWSTAKRGLIATYGIPEAEQKKTCRRKLESPRQGNLPTRQFQAAFQAVLSELPSGASLPMDTLRNTYLRVMNPVIAYKFLVNLSAQNTCDDVAKKAIIMEDLLYTFIFLTYTIANRIQSSNLPLAFS